MRDVAVAEHSDNLRAWREPQVPDLHEEHGIGKVGLMLASVLRSAPGGLAFAYPVTTFRVFAHSAVTIASGTSRYGGTAGKRRRERPPVEPAAAPDRVRVA